MAVFEITMTDATRNLVIDAEAYGIEGPMTTFFTTDDGRGRLDSWATRVASVRSTDVAMIRRLTAGENREPPRLDLVVDNSA